MGAGGAEVPQGADPSGRHADRSQGERVNQGEAVQGELQLSTRPVAVETDNDRRAQVVCGGRGGRGGVSLCRNLGMPARQSLSFNLSLSFYQFAEQTGAGNEGAGRAAGQGYQGFQVHGVLRHDAGGTQR